MVHGVPVQRKGQRQLQAVHLQTYTLTLAPLALAPISASAIAASSALAPTAPATAISGAPRRQLTPFTSVFGRGCHRL